MTQHDQPGTTVAPVRKAVRPAPRPPAVPHPHRMLPSGALLAAVVLQIGQAAVWLLIGIVMTFGDTAVRPSTASALDEPVAVVLAIAAILAFAICGFVLALAAGVLRRSDVCRVASVIVQVVFGALVLTGTIEIIRHGGGLRIALDPLAGPSFPITPGFVGVLLASCVAAVVLLTRPAPR